MSAVELPVPATDVFRDRSTRWVNATARAGKLPGAFKVGGRWYVFISRLAAGGAPDVPTEAAATADLRARGIL